MNQFGSLGYTIWDTEFGDHETEPERASNAVLISGYLEANVGKLNTLLNTDFQLNTGTDTVSPTLKLEENGIFTQIYLKDYYQKQARNALRNIVGAKDLSTGSSISDWTELREGDSYIKRSVISAGNKTESSRLFAALARDAGDTLDELVYAYNMYGSKPTQVAGKDAEL